MGKPRGRTVAIVAGILVLGVALIAGVCWKPIAAGLYLHRLQNDPAALRELILAGEGSAKGLAVTRHIESEDGKQQLFELYLSVFLAQWEGPTRQQGGPFAGPAGAKGATLGDVEKAGFASAGRRYSYRCEWKGGGTNAADTLGDSENHEVLRAMTRFFPKLLTNSFAHGRYPNHRFTFTTANKLGVVVGLFFTAAEHRTGAFLLVERIVAAEGE